MNFLFLIHFMTKITFRLQCENRKRKKFAIYPFSKIECAFYDVCECDKYYWADFECVVV